MAMIERYRLANGDKRYRVQFTLPNGEKVSKRGFRTTPQAGEWALEAAKARTAEREGAAWRQ